MGRSRSWLIAGGGILGLVVLFVALSPFSNEEHCPDNSGPEVLIVDASRLAAENTVQEVCLIETGSDGRFCGEEGSTEVGMTWNGEYPRSMDYEVVLVPDSGGPMEKVSGTYELQCIEGSVRLGLDN